MGIYKTEGVCAREIRYNVEDQTVKEVEFVGGCPGNAMGISRLVEGMALDDVIERLSGIKCGNKDTSCPDQLAKLLTQLK